MKYLSVFLLLLICPLILFSQTSSPDNYTREWGSYCFKEAINEIALDENDNIWIAGDISNNVYFDTIITSNAYQSSYEGNGDIYIVQFSPEGNLLYASYFGGNGVDNVESINIDNGKLYITGKTTSDENITTIGAYQEDFNSNSYDNSFIAQFDINSGQLNWGTYYQGNRNTRIYQIKGITDVVYVWGETSSSDLGTSGAFQESIPGSYIDSDGDEVFPDYPILVKFDDNGDLKWATYYGPGITSETNDELVYVPWHGLAVDNSGDVYVSGTSRDQIGFYGTNGVHKENNTGVNTYDSFISKFSPSGQRIWSTYYGGSNSEGLTRMFIPRGDFIYVTGITLSDSNITTANTWIEDFPTGMVNPPRFVAKFNLNGQLNWGSYLAADSNSVIFMDVDEYNNIFTYSTTSGLIDDTVIVDNYQSNIDGNTDNLLLKLNSSGSNLEWGTYYGGEGSENVPLLNSQISIDSQNSIIITGITTSENNISTANAFQEVLPANNSSFIAKFTPCPDPETPIAEAIQEFEPDQGKTLADLEVEIPEWSGSAPIVTWYADAEGNTEIDETTELEDGETYYVSRKIQGCDESDLVGIMVEETLSLNSEELKGVKLFPNPNKGTFKLTGLHLKEAELTIYDIRGRALYHQELSGSNDYQIKPVKQLTSGIYFVQLTSTNKSRNFKMVVE